MADVASSSRKERPLPGPATPEQPAAEVIYSSGGADVLLGHQEATVISNRPPISIGPLSDSVYRILQGKILPGDQLGDYELAQYVGGGGMGRVFRALDTRLARTVALKILSPEQAADHETLQRFQNEAQSAARLDHENIARVFHVGEDRGLHYIVFEFIEGVNIRAHVERQGPLPLAEAVSYALQVVGALAHAASRSVVHRDIKPSNVLITPSGQVKLIDMGLARLMRAETMGADLTATGVTLGTFDYISPEQARDPRCADVRSDIYSLGCTFFYMLTGRPPFPEGTVLQKLLQHQGDQPPDVRQFRPELPEEVSRILRKMLAKDPRHRYGEPAVLADELLNVAVQIGLRPLGPGGRTWVLPRPPAMPFLRRHLPWIVPTTALACIVLLLNIVWSDRETHVPPPSGGATEEFASLVGPTARAAKVEGVPPARAPKSTAPSPAPPSKTESALLPAAAKPGQTASPTPAAHAGARPAVARSPEPAASKPVEPPAAPAAPLLSQEPGVRRERGSGLGIEPLAAGLAAVDRDSLRFSLPEADNPKGLLTGAAGATEPGDTASVPEPTPRRSAVLVVSDGAEGENAFTTLDAACTAAKTGDVIELRYNGRRQERPLVLTNRRITICAGKGFLPAIVFRPAEADPVKCPRSMFILTGGRLTMINTALELHVPREVPAEEWALFETQGHQTVRLEKCSMSIANADRLSSYHADVAFFRTRSAPGPEVVTPASPGARASIELVDCIARGEAVLLHANDLQSDRLVWSNGLLATTERLVTAESGPKAPAPGESRQVDLRHLTVIAQTGLCRLVASQFAPYQMPVEIRSADSIIVVPPGVPLIEQVGPGKPDDRRKRILWNAERNFYEGVDAFWVVRGVDPQSPAELMNFDAWLAYWGPSSENQPTRGRVAWQKLPEPDRPFHLHTPADYALNEATEGNAALKAASDGQNAGCQTALLPALPPLPTAEKPSRGETPADATSFPRRASR